MKPLSTNRLMLTWLFFLPAETTVSIQQKLSYLLVFLIVFEVTVTYYIGYWAYLLKHLPIDLEEALYAVYEVSVAFGVIFITVAAPFERYKMNLIFEGLEIIYDERKNHIDSESKTDYISNPISVDI